MGRPFEYVVQLRWSDEDRLGHVNNTRYLTFGEDARLRLMSELPGSDTGILARLECDFLAQGHATPDASVTVRSGVESVGRSSMRLRQAVVADDGTKLADMLAVLVAFDYDADEAVPWTDEQRRWLEQYSTEV